jgi:hypothetical protein
VAHVSDERPPRRSKRAARAQPIEDLRGLVHRGNAAREAQRAARDLAQAVLAGGGSQPRRDEHEQGGTDRALKREVKPAAADHVEHQRAGGQQRGERQTGAHRSAIGARGDRRDDQPDRDSAEHVPRGRRDQHAKRDVMR